MSELFSLEQIRDAALANRTVLNGTSPAVQQQNEHIARMLRTGSALEAPAIMGTQLLGSRAQGSAELGSDLDVAIITYEDQQHTARNLAARLSAALHPVISVDNAVAPMVLGIMRAVPATPERFINKVMDDPANAVSFYETGVYDTPALRLAALAANEIMLFDGWEEAQHAWDRVRPVFARAYVGKHDRFCKKVSERLMVPQAEVKAVITEEVWRDREARFGLPQDFATQYDVGRQWLDDQPDIPEMYAQSMVIFEAAREEKYRRAAW